MPDTEAKVNIGEKRGEPAEFEIPVRIIDREKKHIEPVKIMIEGDNEQESPMKGSEQMEDEIRTEDTESREERIAELEEQVRRLSAEFANFRIRQDKKLDEIRKYASENVIAEFLPTLDSIEKAIEAAEKADNPDSIKKGMEMISNQLKQTLERLGVEEIHAHMETFDPAMHQAIHVVETDAHPDETVIGEFQKGYRYKDRVLRPAMVQVSRLPGNIGSAEDNEPGNEM